MKVCFGNTVSNIPVLDQTNIYSPGNISMPNSVADSYINMSENGVELGNVIAGKSPQTDATLKETFKNLGYKFSTGKEVYSGLASGTHIGLDNSKSSNKMVHIKELNSEDILSINMRGKSSKAGLIFPASIRKEALIECIPSLKDIFSLFLKQDANTEDLIIDKISIKNGGKISGKNLKFKEIDAEGYLSIIDTENKADRIVSKGTIIIDSSQENVNNKTANYVSNAHADKYLGGYFIADKASAGTSISLNYKSLVKEAKAGKALCLIDSASVDNAVCDDRIYSGDSTAINNAKANSILIEDKATVGNIVINENKGKSGEVIINTDNPNESIKGIIDFQGKKGTIYIKQGQKLDTNKVKNNQNVEIKPLSKEEMDKKIKDFDSDGEITFVFGLGTPSLQRSEKYNAYMKSIGCPYLKTN